MQIQGFEASGGQSMGFSTGISSNMLTTACKTKQLECVISAISQGAQADGETLDWAVASGKVEIVQAVISARALPSAATVTNACLQCDIAILHAVALAGAKADAHTYTVALNSKDPAKVEFVGNLGAPLDEHTLTAALRFPNANALWIKGLIQRGAKTDDSSYSTALSNDKGGEILKEVLMTGLKIDPIKMPDALHWICSHDYTLVARSTLLELAVAAGARAQSNDITALLELYRSRTYGEELVKCLNLLVGAGARPVQRAYQCIEDSYPSSTNLTTESLREKGTVLGILNRAIAEDNRIRKEQEFKQATEKRQELEKVKQAQKEEKEKKKLALKKEKEAKKLAQREAKEKKKAAQREAKLARKSK